MSCRFVKSFRKIPFRFFSFSGSDAESRGGFGEERYEKTDFQEKVRGVFQTLKEGERSQVVTDDCDIDERADWFDVDAKGTIEEVQGRINRVVDVVCKRVEDGSKLKKLFEDGDYDL